MTIRVIHINHQKHYKPTTHIRHQEHHQPTTCISFESTLPIFHVLIMYFGVIHVTWWYIWYVS